MFDKTNRDSGRGPWKADDAKTIGDCLVRLTDEMIRQDHEEEVHKLLDPIVGFAFDVLDDRTMTTEIKAMAADLLRTYGEEWTVTFDDRTITQIRKHLGE